MRAIDRAREQADRPRWSGNEAAAVVVAIALAACGDNRAVEAAHMASFA